MRARRRRVGITIASQVPHAHVIVSDINEAALAAARRNASNNGVQVEVVFSSCTTPSPTMLSISSRSIHRGALSDDADWGLSADARRTNGGSDGSTLVSAPSRRPNRTCAKGLSTAPASALVQRTGARRELKKHYRTVTELARKQVEFFPVKEGSASPRLLQHVKDLAASGTIEMTFENEIPLSIVSVIEARAD